MQGWRRRGRRQALLGMLVQLQELLMVAMMSEVGVAGVLLLVVVLLHRFLTLVGQRQERQQQRERRSLLACCM